MIVLGLAACGGYAGRPAQVELFVQAHCPYAAELELALARAVGDLGPDTVELRVAHLVRDDASALADGGAVESCALARLHDTGPALDFVACLDAQFGRELDAVDGCADQVGLDPDELGACAAGAEGRALRDAEARLADGREIDGSPTMFVDGELVDVPPIPAEVARALCARLDPPLPPACGELPDAPVVRATLLGDERCRECDEVGMTDLIRSSWLPGLELEPLDVQSPAGAALHARIGEPALPVFVFGPDLADTPPVHGALRRLVDADGLRYLPAGHFAPDAELCDDAADDDGDALVDCADPDCASRRVCTADPDPRHLDVVVRPDAVRQHQLLRLLPAVEARFGAELDVRVVPVALDPAEEAEAAADRCVLAERGVEGLLARWRCARTRACDGAPAEVSACPPADSPTTDAREVLGGHHLAWVVGGRYAMTRFAADLDAVVDRLCELDPGLAGCAGGGG